LDGEEAGGGATVQDKLSSGRLAALALSTNPDTRVAHIFCPRKGEKALHDIGGSFSIFDKDVQLA